MLATNNQWGRAQLRPDRVKCQKYRQTNTPTPILVQNVRLSGCLRICSTPNGEVLVKRFHRFPSIRSLVRAFLWICFHPLCLVWGRMMDVRKSYLDGPIPVLIGAPTRALLCQLCSGVYYSFGFWSFMVTRLILAFTQCGYNAMRPYVLSRLY